MMKEARVYSGGNVSFLNKWFWKSQRDRSKKMKLDYCLMEYTKINLKLIKCLNVGPKTLEILGLNTVCKHDIDLGNVILDLIHFNLGVKGTVEKLDSKLSTFLKEKFITLNAHVAEK